MVKKILILDDEEILIKTFLRALQKSGFETYTAKNSQDAIALSEEECFDLMISDIRMPGDNGVQTIKKMYEHCEKKGSKKFPVIFITGFADNNVEEEALSLQPIAYLLKPFDIQEMVSIVKKHLCDLKNEP